MSTLTTQQAYEKVRETLIAQDTYGYLGGSCTYRSELGHRCAVGSLIPDEVYDAFLEDGHTVGETIEGKLLDDVLSNDYLREQAPELFDLINGDTDDDQVKVAFLGEAQSLHDHAARSELRLETFIGQLDDLAANYGLKVSVTP